MIAEGKFNVKFFSKFDEGGDHWDSVRIQLDPGIGVAKRRVAAAIGTFRFTNAIHSPTGQKQASDGKRNKTISRDDFIAAYKDACRNSYMINFLMGHGFRTLLYPPPFPSWANKFKDIEALQKELLADVGIVESGPLSPPKINFIAGNENRVRTILTKMDPATRERFVAYLDRTVLGIAAISGFAGSGKTYVLALRSLIYLAHDSMNLIYASAPTHVAVGNLAARIRLIGVELADGQNKSPLVVHGHAMDTECDAFITMAEDTTRTEAPEQTETNTRFSLPLSLCEWLLKIVRSGGRDLEPHDNPALLRVREEFERPEYEGLRSFVKGDLKYSEVMKRWEKKSQPPASAAEMDLDNMGVDELRNPVRQMRAGKMLGETPNEGADEPEADGTSDNDISDYMNPGDEEAFGDEDDGEGTDPDSGFVCDPLSTNPRRLIRNLLECILALAEVICTTPHASRDKEYEGYRLAANVILLDEAGAMHLADANMVWGPIMRPCIMAGDERQLQPTVMEQTRNRFTPNGRIFILDHLKRSSYPCFVLSRQMRITSGLFELTRELIYEDVKNFVYAENAALENHPLAKQIDAWATAKYSLQDSPPGHAYPVFLSPKHSNSPEDEASSSYNPSHSTVALELAEELVKDGINSDQIVFITPYRANFTMIKNAIAGKKTLSDAIVNTADSFQGRERSIAILVLCVDGSTGHPNRLCVATSWYCEALFVVGDINTMAGHFALDKAEDTRGEEAETLTFKLRTFHKFLQWFKDRGRVVIIDNHE